MTHEDFVAEWQREFANLLFRGYLCEDRTPAGRYLAMDNDFKQIGQRLRAMLEAYGAFAEAQKENGK